MKYVSSWQSPCGKIFLTADNNFLTGLWFYSQKEHLPKINCIEMEKEIFVKTKTWLKIYFSGKNPDFAVPVKLSGTCFQMEIWQILLTIPYGSTTTYGQIAKQIAAKKSIAKMSAQAVGNAIGKNPISIIVPCHRVIAFNGTPGGYAGGLDKKIMLLNLEKAAFKNRLR